MTQHFILQGIINDLKWDGFSEHEQEILFNVLSDRLQNLAIATLLTMANEAQRKKIIDVLQSQGNVEQVISEVAGEIPGFADALQQAMLAEYEHFKTLEN